MTVLDQEFRWRRAPDVARGAPAWLTVNGDPVAANDGESLAVALAAVGFVTLRRSPTGGGARGMFCLMGVCQECVVMVDGVPAAACLEPVRDGMAVTLAVPPRESLSGNGGGL